MKRLTIDEAIEQEKFKARVDRIKANKRIFNNNNKDEISACNRSAEEHEQLAEWLEELKFLKQWKSDVMDEFCKYDCNSVEEARHNGYNKAIDDAIDKISCGGKYNMSLVDELRKLKVGGEND